MKSRGKRWIGDTCYGDSVERAAMCLIEFGESSLTVENSTMGKNNRLPPLVNARPLRALHKPLSWYVMVNTSNGSQELFKF